MYCLPKSMCVVFVIPVCVCECFLHMSDLCACMKEVISEFNSEIEGSFAFCALMLFLCSIFVSYVFWE